MSEFDGKFVGKCTNFILLKRGDLARLTFIYSGIKCKAVNFPQGGEQARPRPTKFYLGKEANTKL